MGSSRMSSLLVVLAVVAVVVALSAPARAVFPGKNGRIAFVQGADIYTMNPNGTDVQQLTFLGPDRSAFYQAWSADGLQLVFTMFSSEAPPQSWVMNGDGSGQHPLLSDASFTDFTPSFSPDGSQVIFTRCEESCTIYRVQVDGTDLTAITHFQAEVGDVYGGYSPDGQSIAFTSFRRDGILGAVWLMNADGSNIRRLTPPELGAQEPDWSPDGSRIAFRTHCCNPQNEEIWTIKIDGTSLTRITDNNKHWDGYNSAPHDVSPSWSPRGDALAFVRYNPSLTTFGIYLISRSGSVPKLMRQGSLRKPHKLPLSRWRGVGKRDMKRQLKLIEDSGAWPRWAVATN